MRSRSSKHKGIALLALLCLLILSLSMTTHAQGAPTKVRVDVIKEGEINVHRSFLGSLHASRTTTASSETSGAVSSMLVDVGDTVRANQTIANLKNETYQKQQAAARAELSRLNSMLAEQRAKISEDELLTRAELQKAVAERDFWQSEKARIAKLEASDDATEQDVAESKRQLAVAEAEVLAKQAMLKQYDPNSGSRTSQIRQIEAEIAAQNAEIERLATDISRLIIRAPFAGFISAKLTDSGEWLSPGSPVATIVALDPIEARVSVPEEVVQFLTVGDEVEMLLNALTRKDAVGRPVPFMGKIKAIAPTGDSRRRAFEVRVEVANNEAAWQQALGSLPAPAENAQANPDGAAMPSQASPFMLLREGMSVNVSLPAMAKQRGMLVSKDAVLLVYGVVPSIFIYQPSEQPGSGMGIQKPVQFGGVKGDMRQVMGDFKPGDKVIVRGNERIFGQQGPVIVEKDLSADAPTDDAAEEEAPAADPAAQE